jgi:hypothetical protein
MDGGSADGGTFSPLLWEYGYLVFLLVICLSAAVCPPLTFVDDEQNIYCESQASVCIAPHRIYVMVTWIGRFVQINFHRASSCRTRSPLNRCLDAAVLVHSLHFISFADSWTVVGKRKGRPARFMSTPGVASSPQYRPVVLRPWQLSCQRRGNKYR